jgi:hypothetical protein
MTITNTEMQGIHAGGLTIGSAGTNRGMRISGITATGSNGIQGVLTLVSSVDDSQLLFDAVASTFNALSAQADNGVIVMKALTTSEGSMYLDGDIEDDSKQDSNNQVNFTDGLIVSAKKTLTLEATMGSISAAGDLTLMAGSGITISNDLLCQVSAKTLVINADYESAGDGDLTVDPEVRVVSNHGAMLVTAADIHLQGNINSGEALISPHTATEGGTMGMGATTSQYTLSSSEAGNIASSGLIFGNGVNSGISVAGVKAEHSNNIGGMLSLVAVRDDAQVWFHGAASTFNSLSVQADNGIRIESTFSSDNGPMTLDGDSDNSSTGDNHNAIAANGDRAVKSVGQLTLNSLSGGITRSGVGTLTLQSGQGVQLNNKIVSATPGQPVIIYADDSGTGNGRFTLRNGKVIHSMDGTVTISASDVDLAGGINTDNAIVSLAVSKAQTSIGVGFGAGQFSVSGDEIQRITSGGLVIGSALSGSIEATGLTLASSNTVTGIISLVATAQFAQVHFRTTSSTFSAVAAQADDGIDVEQDLTTVRGSLTLNGDVDNTDEKTSRDHISFLANLTMTSEEDITLSAKSGGVRIAGPLTLRAKGSIYIDDEFTGPFGDHPVTLMPDYESNGIGRLDIAPAACSEYLDCASCAASRLCGWCASAPSTVGQGSVNSKGLTGTDVEGISTAFLNQSALSVGSLLTVGTQSRIVTAITSDTALTIDNKFESIAAGTVSVFANVGLDHILGSRPTVFRSELRPGSTVTVSGTTRTVAAVRTDSTFTVTNAWSTSFSNMQFLIGGIKASGTVSYSGESSVTITGSWPPAATKFMTEVKPGTVIAVEGVARTVASVVNNQVLTVTAPFPTPFVGMPCTLSNLAGKGTIAAVSGNVTISGSAGVSTQFTQDLRVNDLVTVFGQTKLVQKIYNDHHISVDGFFTTPFEHQQLQIGTVRNQMYTAARKANGTVYLNSTAVLGINTVFASELEAGHTIFVPAAHPARFEHRTIISIQHDGQLLVDRPFNMNITAASATSFYACDCPSLLAADDESQAGSFALHSKDVPPSRCPATGRCVPRSSHVTTFESKATGIISGGTSAAVMTGFNTKFVSELKYGSTISVYGPTFQESRKVLGVNSESEVVTDKALSFTLLASVSQRFIVRDNGGRGWMSNNGVLNSVTGTHTRFSRDLAIGYTIALGDQTRVVTSVLNDTLITINAPFNAGQGGITESAWAYESCMHSTSVPKTFTVDSCAVVPGCCGSKAAGKVNAGNFAYYSISPSHSNQDLRVVLASLGNQVDLFIRRGSSPDLVSYDFKAEGSLSPWVIVVPHSAIQCATNSTSCIPILVGVKGLSTVGHVAAYELSVYSEPHFQNFACSEASQGTQSAKCAELGLIQLGDATFVHDASDTNNPIVMRLTTEEQDQVGAVWWHSKLHLENGFETSFRFRMSSSRCTSSGCAGGAGGDGFALVMYGGKNPDQIGCSGRALGFGSNAANNCTEGIPMSFAVEFDTWHNPELRDINLRGSGSLATNASVVRQHSYAHVAFFSQGSQPNSASHTQQLAGTPAIPNIADGKPHQARLVYIPGSNDIAAGRVFLYIDDMQSFVLTAPVRLARESAYCSGTSKTDRCILDSFGNAYLGFTSATGEIGQVHDIRDWNFCDEPNCGR